MLTGAVVRVVAYSACALASLVGASSPHATIALLIVARLLTGVGMATYQVARNSYVAANVQKAHRGRANGLLGGCARMANILGPAIGGVAYSVGGAFGAFKQLRRVGGRTVLRFDFAAPLRAPLLLYNVHNSVE